MTVAVEVPLNTFVGNGATNLFSFNFHVFLQSQLSVTVTSPTGTTYTLVLGTDYTVQGLNAAGTPAATGSITLVNGGQAWLTTGNLTTGWSLSISRTVPYSQISSIRSQGDFDRAFLEDALDRLAMQIQQLQQEIAVLQLGFKPGTISGVAATSLVVLDLVNGHSYQVVTQNGIIGLEQVT